MTSEKNRFSIYKDASGYLNYRVIDNKGNVFKVDSDISSWKSGQNHHIAASWSLNTKTQSDEMHLFVDGKEVSNTIRYGNNISTRLHQKFRTISTEEIIGSTPKIIVGSEDLATTFGSNQVSSFLNFTAIGISIGDTLYIEESGFNTLGYAITNVSGQTLTLSTTMPLSITFGKFSVNKISFNVNTEVNLYDNIAISTIHKVISGSDLSGSLGSPIVSSTSNNFTNLGIKPGYLISISGVLFKEYYTVVSVSGTSLTLSDNMPSLFSTTSFNIFSNAETELKGKRALFPSYSISRGVNYENIITVRNEVLADDILLLRTFGLNHGRVKNKYYVWGNTSNILNSRLPSPLTLEDVKIYHTLLDTTIIGPNNSTFSSGLFTSNNILTDQPSISTNGRTLEVIVSGDNIDYTTPASIIIQGTINGIAASFETFNFTKNETQLSINKLSQIDYISVICKPIISTRNSITVKIKEHYPITHSENSLTTPQIRYSYQMLVGDKMSGTLGLNVVQDLTVKFSSENINNYLVIYSPISVAGQYLITSVSNDLNQITLSSNLPDTFINGNYEILNVSKYRSGLQNGKFTFEETSAPGIPYTLNQGLYELDYHTGLSIPIISKNLKGVIGNDVDGKNPSKTIIDDFSISNVKLSDTRIGEILPSGQDSITRHYNSLKAMKSTINTLMLLPFDTSPFINASNVYITSSKDFIQSGNSVNGNFNKSISFTNVPLIIDNTGILNTKTEATIDFWISPIYDVGNDPNYRFYFDASGVVSEKILSTNNSSIKVAGKISKILSVNLQNGDKKINYFAGGSIDNDLQTIRLNNKLPNQQTPVIVNYIPTGLNGDRVSIYKDPSGYLNFTINASGVSHQVRAPIFWVKNSWHKIRAQYKLNQGIGVDEIRLFIDGREQGNILYGNGLLFGEHQVYGSSFIGQNNIKTSISFKDPINEFIIGSDYTKSLGAYALIDNLRISNVSRPIIFAFNEAIDPNYNSNIDLVFPVSEDLYTTLMLDFNKIIEKTTDFAVIKNKITGLFDITINVFDSFGILKDNSKTKTVLETLINTLKPANSRVFLNVK